MKTLIVENKFNNKKLIAYLTHLFPNVSQNTFYKALRKKDIRINDIKVTENTTLHAGDELKIYIPDKYLFNFNPNIVYEDDNILIINKEKGIEVTGSNSLTDFLCSFFNNNNIMPCHRLDRNTEGIVVFAKNKVALEILKEKFKNKEIDKFYKCTVYGILNKKKDILKAYLFKDNKKSQVYIKNKKDTGYREIITEYKVLEENKTQNYSILEVVLHTGRTHQIRAHLSYIGHPIIGDRKVWRQQNKSKI